MFMIGNNNNLEVLLLRLRIWLNPPQIWSSDFALLYFCYNGRWINRRKDRWVI